MSIKRTVFTTATLGAVLCLPPFAAVAQAGGHAGHAPATPAAATTTAPGAPSPRAASTYRSAFDGYRRFTDEPVKSWKDANDNVGRIGGWKTYAKEAAAESGDGGSAAGHAGHIGHGAPSAASGQNPPRAGTANTDKPFGQTEATNPPKVAPRPTPAAPAGSQPKAPAGHSQHH